MNKQKILKTLHSHEWKEEEAQTSFHIIDHWKTCYLEGKNAYRRNLYSVCIYSFVNNYTFEWAPIDEAKKVLDWTIKKYKKDKKYFSLKYKEFLKVSSEIKEIFTEIQKEGLRGYKNNDLKKLLIKILYLGKKQYGYALLPEGIDTLSVQDYLDLLPGIELENVLEITHVLSTPEELSFIEKEKLDLLKLTREIFGNSKVKRVIAKKSLKGAKKFPDFFKKLERHTQNYFWIQNSFRGAVYLDSKYFLNSIAELIKTKALKEIKEEIKELTNKQKIAVSTRLKLYKNYKLSQKTKFFFELVRYFTLLQDKRKENIQRLVFCIDQMFNEIKRKSKISKSEIDNYSITEVRELLEKGKRVSKRKLNERKKTVFFSYLKNGQIKTDYLFGKKADLVLDFFKKKREEISSRKEIKGFVASIGGDRNMLIKGRVRIVFDPIKDTFKKGEILVTGMTRPEFVPLMKNAKAIVTNEGGITTHAAIISRELKMPCIIGTKIATDVLHNGDYIQLDLKEGVIKILKK